LAIKGDAEKLSRAERDLLAAVPRSHHAGALAKLAE
jgi:hypothetical protein